MSLSTDRELGIAYATGDLHAFGVLYDRHAPGVHAAACALFGPGSTADGVVVAVFHRLARDLRGRRRARRHPTAHLDQLTRREVRRRLRSPAIRRGARRSDGASRELPARLRRDVCALAATRAPAPPPVREGVGLVAAIGGVALVASALLTGGWSGPQVAASDVRRLPAPGVAAALGPAPTDPAATGSGQSAMVPLGSSGASPAPPEVAVVQVSPQVLLECTSGSMVLVAEVEASGLEQFSDAIPAGAPGSAWVSWIGPGDTGSAPLIRQGAEWQAHLTPAPVAGWWVYSVRVVDAAGRATAANGSFQILACAHGVESAPAFGTG